MPFVQASDSAKGVSSRVNDDGLFHAWADGGARGNPGPAGIGFVIEDAQGTVLREVGEYIGEATNNVAEYKALIGGARLLRAPLGPRQRIVDCLVDHSVSCSILFAGYMDDLGIHPSKEPRSDTMQ